MKRKRLIALLTAAAVGLGNAGTAAASGTAALAAASAAGAAAQTAEGDNPSGTAAQDTVGDGAAAVGGTGGGSPSGTMTQDAAAGGTEGPAPQEAPDGFISQAALQEAADASASTAEDGLEADRDREYAEQLLNEFLYMVAMNEDYKESITSLLQNLGGMDHETARQQLESILRILSDKDFQEFLMHSEVQDFLAVLIRDGGKFIEENPELTKKILVTLDLPPAFADMILEFMKSGSMLKELLDNTYRAYSQGTSHGEDGPTLDDFVQVLYDFVTGILIYDPGKLDEILEQMRPGDSQAELPLESAAEAVELS